jgi:HAD superfamily hydrolase (TIGR01549 family)
MSPKTLHPSIKNAKAVIFDVGGTLMHPDWERLAKLLSADTGYKLTVEELKQTFGNVLRDYNLKLKEGSEPSSDENRPGWLFLRTFRSCGMDEETCSNLYDAMHALHLERHLWSEMDEDAPFVLDSLRQAGFAVAAISNTEDGRVEELLKLGEIADHFDFILDSHLVGCKKPDKIIFQMAIDRYSIEPKEAVYVGDSYGHDALGASNAGLRPILLDPLNIYPESIFPRIKKLKELIS